VLRWLLDPVMGDSLPLITVWGAVTYSVWKSGYRPALLSCVLGYVACALLFIPPRGSLGLGDVRNQVGLAAYLVTSAAIIALGEQSRASQRRVQRAEAQAREQADAVRNSEERFRSIFESVALSLWEEDFSGVKSAIDELRAQGVTDFPTYFQEHPEFVQRAMASIRVLNVNAATVALFEAKDKAELLGSLPKIFVPESMPVFIGELTAVAQGRTFFEAEALLHSVRGNPVHAYFTMALPRSTESFDRVLFSVVDLSARKKAEDALRAANRNKDEFLATLAHELRNPLAPILNSLHIMRLAKGRPDTVEQAQSMVERQLVHMVRLVDDLLDVSRISRNKLAIRPETVDIATVLNSAIESSRPVIESAGLLFSVQLLKEPTYVKADPTRLTQVFQNLLNNAAKFTEPAGRVSLTAERLDTEVVVRVQDSGVGIPPDKLSDVFELFSQVDSSLTRSRGGLGIGLTLVRRLVALHEGRVEARSAGLGRGSEFVVRLPVIDTPLPPKQTTRGTFERPRGPARRVLVVDDSHDSAASLSALLTMMGHETRTATTGHAAVAVAAEYRPDVVVLDIGMPEFSGYDVARALRAEPWGQQILIIAVTGFGQDEDRGRSREAGFDHHLVKPIDPAVLTALLVGEGTARSS
jgi:signal transduction histidine kinase/ActR/RegA family two-component response regulator